MEKRDYSNHSHIQLLEEAFNSVGMSMLRDKGYCARLMAYLYVYGGGNEAVVYNAHLKQDIEIVQEKFKLFGGEVPDRDGVLMIQTAIDELELTGLETPWLQDIYTKYNLKPPSDVSKSTEVPDAYRHFGVRRRGDPIPDVRKGLSEEGDQFPVQDR